MHGANAGESSFVKRVLIEPTADIGCNTTTMGDFNTLLSPLNRATTLKIHKETKLICNIEQMDSYRTFQHTAKKYIHSLNLTFSRIDYIQDHETISRNF